jgi:hypothetical protein
MAKTLAVLNNEFGLADQRNLHSSQQAARIWACGDDLPDIPWVWWNHLERILMAVNDLGCRDLLAT